MEFYELRAGNEIQDLKRVEFFEQKAEQACQHNNKQQLGTMGWERWVCSDCGFQHEKQLN